MADFNYGHKDFFDSDSFIRATGENQTFRDAKGSPIPLRTTRSIHGGKESLSVASISDVMTGSMLAKPAGVTQDIYNRVGQDAVANVMAEHGGPSPILGGAQAIAPTDLLLRTPTVAGAIFSMSTESSMSSDAGNYNTTPLNHQLKGTAEVRNAWGHPNPSARQGDRMTSFTWWSGMTYQVNKLTVPVWEYVDSVLERWEYRVHGSGGGGWVGAERFIGDTGSYSLHAFGLAVDINPVENPYTSTLITDMPPGMVDEILQLKTNSGFTVLRWGGHYSNNKDAMHYEVMVDPGNLQTGLVWGGKTHTSASGGRYLR